MMTCRPKQPMQFRVERHIPPYHETPWLWILADGELDKGYARGRRRFDTERGAKMAAGHVARRYGCFAVFVRRIA